MNNPKDFYVNKLNLLRTLEQLLVDSDHVLGRLELLEGTAPAGDSDDIVALSKKVISALDDVRDMKTAIVPMTMNR